MVEGGTFYNFYKKKIQKINSIILIKKIKKDNLSKNRLRWII